MSESMTDVVGEKLPVGYNKCGASIDAGVITLESGVQVDLLKIQALLNGHFQESGDQDFATAADEVAKLTGLFQGPHGEWVLP